MNCIPGFPTSVLYDLMHIMFSLDLSSTDQIVLRGFFLALQFFNLLWEWKVLVVYSKGWCSSCATHLGTYLPGMSPLWYALPSANPLKQFSWNKKEKSNGDSHLNYIPR